MDVAMSPTGNLLLVANAGYAHHSLMAIDPSTGDVLQVISAAGAKSHGWWDWASGHPTGYYVGLAFSPDGRHAWASDGPGGAIHANPVGNELYVASGDGDSVTVLDGTTGSVRRTIDLRPSPDAPVGAGPDGLAVSPDGGTLYVSNGGDDDVAVIELGSATTA